jgi:hypothetical protein
MTFAAKEHDDMVVIPLRAQVHEQGRLTLHPQGAGGEHCALDAVGPALAQDFAHRQAGLAADFEIGGHRIQKTLDFRGRGKPGEDQELGTGKTQVFSAGKTCSQFSAP